MKWSNQFTKLKLSPRKMNTFQATEVIKFEKNLVVKKDEPQKNTTQKITSLVSMNGPSDICSEDKLTKVIESNPKPDLRTTARTTCSLPKTHCQTNQRSKVRQLCSLAALQFLSACTNYAEQPFGNAAFCNAATPNAVAKLFFGSSTSNVPQIDTSGPPPPIMST